MQIPTHTASSHKRGFTLIELIVVIAIIATLLSVGIGTLKNTAASKGVSTGVSIAQGVFENARNQAKSRGRARVVIYADTGGDNKDLRERYLKYMAIAVPKLKSGETDASDPANIEWRLISSGVALPKDTFFNINLCPGVPGYADRKPKGKAIFPGASDEKDCYYYEFNSEGALVSTTNAGETRFVIQLGTIRPGDTVPTEFPTRKKDAGGFAVWENGRISVYRSIKQIQDGNVKF